MGGDNAPDMVIEGIDTALADLSDVRFLIYGDEAKVRPLLDRFPAVKA